MVHGLGLLNNRPSLNFPDFMLLVFSNNKQEREFAIKHWKENLVEADEGRATSTISSRIPKSKRLLCSMEMATTQRDAVIRLYQSSRIPRESLCTLVATTATVLPSTTIILTGRIGSTSMPTAH